MKPGRELDKLIAERVLGWVTLLPGSNTQVGLFSPYSTDIAAAWQVVEKLVDMGYVVSICWGPGGDGQRYASIQMQLDIALAADLAFRNPRDMDAVAETVPLAICLAALKAFNVEVEDETG